MPGTGNPLRWFFSAIWLVYLIQPVDGLFGHHHGVLWIAGGLAITLAFCALYVPTMVDWDGRPRLGRAGLAAIAALAALACVVYGKGWTPLWIYVSAATGMVLAAEPDGRRRALRGVLAVGVCYVFFSWLSHDDAADFLVVLLPVVLIGAGHDRVPAADRSSCTSWPRRARPSPSWPRTRNGSGWPGTCTT